MLKRLRSIAYALVCLLLILPATANAQVESSATLSAPNTDSFPRIETYLVIHDTQGHFVRGISVEDIRLLENDTPIATTQIAELHPGVQFVVAVNPGPSFAIRDSQALSRYDYLVEDLANWAGSRSGSTIDDLSLLTTNGPEISHVSDPTRWLEALTQGQVDARDATPSLDILFRAISLASDTPPRPGMGRAVLFITPPPEGDAALSLDNVISQANAQEVSVFVWMVSAPGALTTAGADQLIALAERTGGQFFVYTGEETLPDPELYLEPKRHIYHLDYDSRIENSGTHQLLARVLTAEGQIESPAVSFEIDIQPPQPAFVAPPILILRSPPSEQADPGASEIPVSDYIPNEKALQVIFEFPDGRLRPLVSASLFVDGELISENTEPPFDQFTWELGDYAADGTHILQVQVEDSLGLVGSSVETPVQININKLEPNPWASFQDDIPVLSGIVVLLAGSVLLLVLVLGGRLRPRSWGLRQNRSRKSDPVTQPVPVKSEPAHRRMPSWANRLQRGQGQAAPEAFAFLSRIGDADNLPISQPIPLTTDETLIGSDSNQVSIVLEDPSVEAIHARLIREPDSSYRLADEGSIAGTWINYTPVSKNGAQLEHGDLAHIGRIGFRFTIRQPGRVRKPVILPESSLQNDIPESQS